MPVGRPLPCAECEEVYGHSLNFGGSHYHCGNCGLVSGFQGHWRERSQGFECPEKPGDAHV